MRIEVTQWDINRGERGNGCLCPVALALKRIIRCDRVTAFGFVFSGRHSIQLPEDAIQFIHDFDGCLNPAPFSFDANIPEELLRTKP